MIDFLFLIKFVIAVGTVIVLSDLFERVNPRIAGILSGYPVGVALSLFFFGLENGEDFASRSAIFNIVGIVPFLSFIWIYFLASRKFTRLAFLISTALATFGFLFISFVLQQIQFTYMTSVIFASIFIIVCSVFFSKIRKMQTGINAKVTLKSIFIKAIIAGSIITGVTTIAGLVGPVWAGLLASFPATTLPLVLMVHRNYSTMHLHAFLKYIPIGSFSIMAYVSAVYYFYPRVGIYFGTVIAYGVATVIILLYYFIENTSIIKKLRETFNMADQSIIHFIITGGTIDFHYERRYDTIVPNKKSIIPEFINTLDFVNAEYTELFIKDSRTLSDTDNNKIVTTIEKSPYSKIIVTTGTFKIDKLAKTIGENIKNNTKTIVLTGSTTPISGFTPSEGLFNLGHAVACAQSFDKGIYISFNGEVFKKEDIDRLIREGGLAAIFQIKL